MFLARGQKELKKSRNSPEKTKVIAVLNGFSPITAGARSTQSSG
jgi:hypothetical protein